ncbi:MAG TPA: hypothetical protein VK589_29725 [Chryseolinea sp.]|nr:hypothetical protein [Chryseolinea sp.]
MARRKKPNEDQPQENLDNADDTFGLPEIEYEPLKRDTPDEENTSNETSEVQSEPIPFTSEEPVAEIKEEEQPKEEFVEENQFYEPSYSYSYEDEKPAIWPKVLGVLLVLLIAGGAVWYFSMYRPKQQQAEEQLRRERLAAQEDARKKETARLEEQRRLEEEQKKTTAATATVAPPAGTIETLSDRQGRYFVVVASSIDGDLIMDYAKKLSAKGVTTHIIPPFGNTKFHRLAVANGDTYANAQATADGMKGGDYGDKLWVIKY